ncbi:MAG TPA: branched-chain amino acid ABC transporter permease [Micromonosporaceae bacterium]|nr:branched-chain amino acid ABC transporter permease [Micromonosporaceae bacterium]
MTAARTTAPLAVGRLGVLATAVAVVALVAAPWMIDSYVISLASKVLVLGLLAMSVSLLTGVAGLPTLGQAAYFGVGAYAAALTARTVTQVGVVQLAVAVAVSAAVAAVTGIAVVRTRGITFLMLTLAIGELAYSAALEWSSVTGGSDGRAAPHVVPLWGMGELRLDGYIYLWVLAVFLVLFAVVAAVVRSPFGLALRGIRDNEARLRAAGYPTARYLLGAYTFAGGLAGAAGALWISSQHFVSPSETGFTVSAMALIAVVLGGLGSMSGAVAGTAVVVLTRDYIGGGLGGRGPLLLGVVFVLAVYLLPRGLAGLRTRFARPRVAAGAPAARRPGTALAPAAAGDEDTAGDPPTRPSAVVAAAGRRSPPDSSGPGTLP